MGGRRSGNIWKVRRGGYTWRGGNPLEFFPVKTSRPATKEEVSRAATNRKRMDAGTDPDPTF